MIRDDVTITYRPHTSDLIEMRVKWLNDPAVNQHLGSSPTNQAKQKIWFEQYEQDESKHFFTILADSQPIGVVGLMKSDLTRKTAEAFVMIGEAEYRGRGLGVAAIEYIKQYATGIGLTSLYLGVHQENQAAIHAYQSAGFAFNPAKDDAEWLAMNWHSKTSSQLFQDVSR
ncbi:MAG: GNAT family N-acetyltransferase [bacterium]|nr:GNAT family N-acetyltransferase [bacterium]